ncbi:hypothetical protein E3Q06_04141 [Wallemia mellicola]|nr:hypothetical protein E3Q21_04143 [Wallemia mellicola]TIB83488.1 hypothetical protein E3Q20_04124 [Wallemia mellicola]TIC31110.1 hypothetical protein E3Q09_04136 [Wallemia mellicola]TIC37756.1 hypothetical protein E3Q07_04153 [Wallemia mellicola]TIC44834.1 hypothetical protein E3Q06_04141 [Wallemia mellicola]
MTEKVEDINEKVNRLEKHIEELDELVNVYLLPKKRKGDDDVPLYKGLSKMALAGLVLFHFSQILDLTLERYMRFWMKSLCRFYQLFAHNKLCF